MQVLTNMIGRMFIKALAVAALAFAAAAGGTFVGRSVYTPFQLTYPIESALKTTPDAANIWSWQRRRHPENLCVSTFRS